MLPIEATADEDIGQASVPAIPTVPTIITSAGPIEAKTTASIGVRRSTRARHPPRHLSDYILLTQAKTQIIVPLTFAEMVSMLRGWRQHMLNLMLKWKITHG